jgi:hypothetical protein
MRKVQSAGRGLSEGAIGTPALKRGYKVVVYGKELCLTKTFFQLGGKVKKIKTDEHLILKCLQSGVPSIILIPNVSESYEHELEEIGHYVIISGIDHKCRECFDV